MRGFLLSEAVLTLQPIRLVPRFTEVGLVAGLRVWTDEAMPWDEVRLVGRDGVVGRIINVGG